MLDVFGGFASFFRAKRSYIDSTIFRLHYKTTFAILLLSSLLVTTSQFIGDPIQCIVDGVPENIMNTYCWILGTFTIPSQISGRIGSQVAHPGVGPRQTYIDPNDLYLIEVTKDGDEIRHAWYQWVCFVLFFQALLCYFPHFLWKNWEGGKLRLIIQGLDEPRLDGPESTKERRNLVVNYMMSHLNTHNFYIAKFIFCELLNLANIVTQIYLMDVFLGGQFSTYGLLVLTISEQPFEKRIDPMSKIFPKVTKCTFHKFGPSGTVENKDGLCVLAQNIINEKIYVALWFWYLTLALLTFGHFLIRVLSVMSTHLRVLLLHRLCRANSRSDVRNVVKKSSFGDWFLLMQMANHIQPVVFHDILVDLRDLMGPKKAETLEE